MDRQGNARAHRVHQNAPELAQAMTDGIVSLNDATRIQFEPEDVRRQAVDDVREGRAETGARAIRQRYGRDPVPRSRRAAGPLRRSAGAPACRAARRGHRLAPRARFSFASCSAK